MAKDGQIHIVVAQDQKDRWKEYVEDSNQFESLTNLVRVSVEKEISGEQEAGQLASPALEEDIQTLLQDVDRIRKDVSWLRKQEQDEVDVSDLAQDVFSELEPLPQATSSIEVPEDVDDEETYRQQQAAALVLQPDDADEAESEGVTSHTTSALSEHLGTTEDRIEDAIDHLQDQFLPVVAVDVDGETHYFRED